MTRRRKKNPFLLYLLIALNLAASALAIYGLSGQWKITQEGRSTYEELQQVFKEHSDTLIASAGQGENTQNAVSGGNAVSAINAGGDESLEDDLLEMEEEETDLTADMWVIAKNQASFQSLSVPQPDGEEAESPQDMQSPIATGDFFTPNPALYVEQTAEAGAVTAGAGVAEDPAATPRQTPVPTTEPWMERAVFVDEARQTMDFPYFQELYPEMAAWLYQDGTKMNYPVMQGEDNEYYLDRLYNGKKNKNGSIFLDSGNSSEFIDANNYIYGHNTKTGDMFGMLANYKEQSYYNAHPQLTLITPYSDFCIDIFAATESLVEDEESWRIKQFTRKADFDAYIADLKEKSFFRSDVTPEWGDQFLVLCTCTNIAHGERYVVYGRMRPIRYGTEESIGLTKADMDARPSQSGKRIVGSLGPLQLYAQNDELWKGLRYEARDSKKKRTFAEGGNGPTAVAMAVANLVPLENLPRLLGYARATAGFTFCDHTVNQYFCTKLHAQYEIRTPQEFLRYLPIAIASFTTGNNLWEDEARDPGKGGTSMSFLPYVAGIYGLELRTSLVLGDALETLRGGGMVVCMTTGRSSPFTGGSQYVVLAGMDDQYLYILDPYLKSSYSKTDTSRVLEIVTPNATRVHLSNIDRIGLNSFYMLSKGS